MKSQVNTAEQPDQTAQAIDAIFDRVRAAVRSWGELAPSDRAIAEAVSSGVARWADERNRVCWPDYNPDTAEAARRLRVTQAADLIGAVIIRCRTTGGKEIELPAYVCFPGHGSNGRGNFVSLADALMEAELRADVTALVFKERTER